MTTLVEKRSHGDVIAGFLVLVAALAAWRGAEGAPVAAALAGVFAVVTALGWAWWRRQPRSELKVSAESITWGSPTKEVTRLEPGETGLLKFHQNAAQQTGWSLARADDGHEAAISMFGFDLDEVRQTCIQHGWRFE